MKDRFSKNADQYAKFRPNYPTELFSLIDSLIPTKDNCWDCGTGNGQLAIELAKSFNKVYATDISINQIAQALPVSNLHYTIQPAEKTDFPDDLFDLVIVGQAIHWFDFKKFYEEVKRTCTSNALLVVVGYGLLNIDDNIDQIIHSFYKDVIGSFWDKERRYIDEMYQTIPFPFEEIKHSSYTMTYNWTFQQLIGYLNTWSAVKHFIKKHQQNPVDQLTNELAKNWKSSHTKSVSFPMLLRIGKVQ